MTRNGGGASGKNRRLDRLPAMPGRREALLGLASTGVAWQLNLGLLGHGATLGDHRGDAATPFEWDEDLDYRWDGPFQAAPLPVLEHTCTAGGCNNAPADRARIRIHAWAPKGGRRLGIEPPYPLAIITPGFLLASDQYASYARRLASWGYVAVLYDQLQAALSPLSDVVCTAFLRDLIDWCRTSVPLGSLCDTNNVYFIGHSRGAKVSVLTAAEDPRVKALFLIDPVDTTVYAPLSPDYPSAVAALSTLSKEGRRLPVGIIGSGRGGDCVPIESNYSRFYEAAPGPAWEAVVQDAGHLQFLDARGGNAMDLVCLAGKVPDPLVSSFTQAMMVAWGDLFMMVRSDTSTESSNGHSRHSRVKVPINKLATLYSTESRIRGSDQNLNFETRAKNFDLMYIKASVLG